MASRLIDGIGLQTLYVLIGQALCSYSHIPPDPTTLTWLLN